MELLIEPSTSMCEPSTSMCEPNIETIERTAKSSSMTQSDPMVSGATTDLSFFDYDTSVAMTPTTDNFCNEMIDRAASFHFTLEDLENIEEMQEDSPPDYTGIPEWQAEFWRSLNAS